MRVYEVSDLEFTTGRHLSGGNTVVSFGDSAFLYGGGSPVVVRQRGSKARMAFVTIWAKFAIVTTPDGDLIDDYSLKVSTKDVHSLRVQAHLRALKRRGYEPFRGLTKRDFIYKHETDSDISRWSAYSDLFDTLGWAHGDGLHVDNVWVARLGASVVRDGWHAIATAVVMVGGEFDRDEDEDRSALIDCHEKFVASLGLVKH